MARRVVANERAVAAPLREADESSADDPPQPRPPARLPRQPRAVAAAVPRVVRPPDPPGNDDLLRQAAQNAALDPADAPVAVEQGFQAVQRQAPTLDQMTGAQFLQLAPRALPLPDLVDQALVKATREDHRRKFKWVKDTLAENPEFIDMPLEKSLAMALNECRKARHWRWATAERFAHSLTGMLNRLPQYSSSGTTCKLTDWKWWEDTLTTLKNKSNSETANAAHPLTSESVEQILKLIEEELRQVPRPETKAERIALLLVLAWFAAARVGDVLQLRWADIVPDRQDPEKYCITWRRGKGVRCRGAYSTTIFIPARYRTLMAPTHDPTKKNDFIFPMQKSRLRQEITAYLKLLRLQMRKVNPRFEARSIRRGRLQELSEAGASLQTVMHVAGHTREQTTNLYLMDGARNVADQDTMFAAAKQASSAIQVGVPLPGIPLA